MEKFLNLKQNSSVVISGISGRFPRSRNLKIFTENLRNKVDLIDDDESRWLHFNPEVPKRFGKVEGLEKFDASFFSYLEKHTASMDPQARVLLEHSYEAIVDAGVSPQSLMGSRTGVFVACMLTDSRDTFVNFIPTKEGLGMSGNAMYNLSNRISYVLGLCGPSLSLDTACSGSAYALDAALKAIHAGDCDAALVAGTNLILNQQMTRESFRGGLLSKTGESRPFDEKASGYVRSEAICVLFLQKREDSKRVYAEVVHVKTCNDGFKEEGSAYPSTEIQQKLMKKLYDDINVDPSKIDFVEAHSTGTKVGDPQEVIAIEEVFCSKRKSGNPLVIGSVKGNTGHCEAAAGVTSIAKVLMIFESGEILPNINISQLRLNVSAFEKGKIRVATELEKFNGELIPINSFGIGGANAHILLRKNTKEKVNFGIPSDDLPRLICWSGRTEEAVEAIFEEVCQRPLDAEFVALLQSSQTTTNPGNIIRGYGLFKHDEINKKAVCVSREMQNLISEAQRPVVWVYSGMGSQWLGMVSDLMKIPIFAESINKSHDVLMTKNVNLKQIIESSDAATFDNILNSYLAIIAIEIALTDLLKSLGLHPDYIIGHSVGELGCAYADECLTAEEAILSAFARGSIQIGSDSVKGGMAAVGLHHSKVRAMLPVDLDIACHNGSNSTTVSGPAESIQNFIQFLERNNIFAKNVASSGVAFHSRYIQPMGQKFFNELKKVIKSPKKRTMKWLSSTFSKDLWDKEETQLSSAEYHTQNLLNPVLFEEVCKMLPSKCIAVEIGPHKLLQSILKMNMKKAVTISLMQRGEKNGTAYLMENLGKVFINGVDFDIAKLYPPIAFPVSRGTPMISPNLKWNHEANQFVPFFDPVVHYSRRNMVINLSDKNFEFMKGHMIGDRVIFPAAGWIYYIWESFALMLGKSMESLKVEIHEINFLQSAELSATHDVNVTIAINVESGKFEVTEDQSILCNGTIMAVEEIVMTKLSVPKLDTDNIVLNENEYYKIYDLMGNCYRGAFREVKEMRADQTRGKFLWKSNWITFLDAVVLNCFDLKVHVQTVFVHARKIVIDPELHLKLVGLNGTLVDYSYCPYTGIGQAGGVEFHGGRAESLKSQLLQPVCLEKYEFIPYFPTQKLSLKNCVKIFLQIIVENLPFKRLKIVEIDSHEEEEFLSHEIISVLADMPAVQAEVNLLSSQNHPTIEKVNVTSGELSQFSNIDVVIKSNFDQDISQNMTKTGFVISRKPDNLSKFNVISQLKVDNGSIFLLQLKQPLTNYKTIEITSKAEEWLKSWLKESLITKPVPTIVFSHEKSSGIVGLTTCLLKEIFEMKLKCFLVSDASIPRFNTNLKFFEAQAALGLNMNVYKDGQWGSYRHVNFNERNQVERRSRHCFVDCVKKGDFSSLSWVPGSLDVNLPNIATVYYAALNFRDILFALGKLQIDKEFNFYGYEFSGVTKDGQRIMGYTQTGRLLSSHFDLNHTNDSVFWNVPDSWSLRDAASGIFSFATVYFAFFRESSFKAGSTVLIHAGSGGVGIAAIQCALSYGLEVFTTVSSAEKKNFLMQKFPKLKEDHIGNSRNTSFEQMVMAKTKGEGVDIVLNSLSGELLDASFRCVKKHGTMIEIGRADIQNGTKISLGHFNKLINYKVLMMDKDDLEPFKPIIKLVERDLQNGLIQPIDSTVFNASEVEKAFNFMTSGQHIGKILIKIRDDDELTLPVSLLPRISFNSNECVIIVGGLGGFGIELGTWLVSRGCRNLVLCSRNGMTNGYQAFRIRQWKLKTARVFIFKSDASDRNACESMIEEAVKLGPVSAIFNLAGVLIDKIFENQTVDTFEPVFRPKVDVTKHLDEVSREKCPELKHFILFSSVACGRGNAGQSNYAMANSIAESIVLKRNEEGLPGTAIQWGPIGDVGMLEQRHAENKDLVIAGTTPQDITSCLDVLDKLMFSESPVVSSMVVAYKKFTKQHNKNIMNDLIRILTIRADKSLAVERSLKKLGVDSLTTVEIQQLLEREYDTFIPANTLRSLSINEIVKKIETNMEPNEDEKETDLQMMELRLLNSLGDEKTVDQIFVRGNDVVCDNSPITVIIPGIYGTTDTAYFELAKKIKHPTYIMQFHKTYKMTEFSDMIEFLKPHVIDLIQNRTFIFIGQSFGAIVGLKLAGILEGLGKFGHLVSLDGSPKLSFKVANRIVYSDTSSDGFNRWSLKLIVRTVFGLGAETDDKISKILAKTSLDAKVEVLYEYLKPTYSFSYNYLRHQILEGIAHRSKMTLEINDAFFTVLQETKITLLRASEPFVKEIAEDYELAKFSIQPLTNIVLEGTHETIVFDLKLPQIVNSLN